MSIHARVSKEIMDRREARKLTKIKAAEKCGITPRDYLDLENGHSLPSLPTALNMAVALGISWDALAQELFGQAQLCYRTFEEQLVSENGEAYCGYGLECIRQGAAVGRIPDVSCDKDFVGTLAQCFTAYQLEPTSFLGMVQEMLDLSMSA